jgi:D-alanyl-D-alanine carboxypeptidase
MRFGKAFVFWAAILCAAMAGRVDAQVPSGEDGLPGRFQAALDGVREAYGFPGAIAAYRLPDGTTGVFATGMADQEAAITMRTDHKLMSGSVGKTFTAAVALDLIANEKIGLDANIATWFEQEPWFARLPNHDSITLRHLLNHSSGLVDHVNTPEFAKAIAGRIGPHDLDAYFTPEEMIAIALDREPLFPAGEGYSYTDTGYILLGRIIEIVTGEPYYHQLRQRVLYPLALNHTAAADRRDLPGLAAGYLAEDNPLGLPRKNMRAGILVFNPASEWTGGGLITNPVDLVRWAKLLYEGAAFEHDYLETMLSSTAPRDDAATAQYGLGVNIVETPVGLMYGHNGWFPGYNTFMGYFPDNKFSVAVQVNRDFDNDSELAMKLVRVVHEALSDRKDTAQ